MRKVTWRLAALLLFILVIFTGCSKSPEKTMENFKKIIEENDAKALLELPIKEKGLYWTEKEAKYVIENFKEDPELYKQQLELLHHQAEAIKNKTFVKTDEGIFYFDEEGNIHIRSYRMNVESNEDINELNVKVNGEKVATTKGGGNEDVDLGIYGPGEYEIQAEAKYKYATVTDKIEEDIMDFYDFNVIPELNLNGNDIYLIAKREDIKLIINGEDEIPFNKLDDFGNDYRGFVFGILGPVSEEVTVQGIIENKLTNLEGETYTIGEEERINITPHILKDKKDREEIASAVTVYYNDLFKALVKKQKKYIKNMPTTSEVKEKYSEIIDDLLDDTYTHYFDGELKKTLIDFGNAEIAKVDESNEEVLVLSVELYGNLEEIIFSRSSYQKGQMQYNEKKVYLKKHNDKWIIHDDYGSLENWNPTSELKGEHVVETDVK